MKSLVNEYSHLSSGLWFCPQHPTVGTPTISKTSSQQRDADVGTADGSSPLLASQNIQLPAYPLKNTCTPPPPPLPSSLEIFPYQYTELFIFFKHLHIPLCGHTTFFFPQKQIPFVSKNSATILLQRAL